jgi:hypothetical protein
MPHDLHVFLKNPSTNILLLPWRSFFCRAPSDPFTFSTLLHLHCFLKCPYFPHLRHTFTNFLGDLDLPLDLDIPLEDLDLFISWEFHLANNAYVLYPSMFFLLIFSNNKDETTSSKHKVVVLLLNATTRLSHEYGKEHSKLIHLSSFEILISTDTN